MKILENKDCKKCKKNDSCELYEYPTAESNSNLEMSIAKISGKYPDRGYCINLVCKEIIYIIEGEGIIYEEEKENRFKKGDIIIIKNGERFKWDAHCTISVCYVPEWNPNQYDIMMD